MSCKNTEAWNFSRVLTQSKLNILVIISISIAKALQYIKNRSSHWDVFYKTVVLTISCESREVTSSFKKTLEKIFWASSLLIQLLFRHFLQGFCLDSKLLLLLHFRFLRACIFQNTSFSHIFMVAGLGITRQLTRWETEVLLILFTFLGCLRLPETLIKIWGMMLTR